MIELFRNRQYRNLLISLAALDSAQLFMLYVFWGWLYISESWLELEIAFIIYSAIITITLIAIPYLVNKRRLFEHPKTLGRITYISCIAAFLSSFIAFLPGIASLFVSLSLISLFIFIPHAICLTRIAREFPDNLIGRAVGIIVAIAMLFVNVCVFLVHELESTLLVYITFAALIAVAAFFFRTYISAVPATEARPAERPAFSRKMVIIGVIAFFCYAIIAGLDDNIRYIVELEHDYEGLLSSWFVFSIGALIYLLAGYLADKIRFLKHLIFTCFIAICAIFALLLVVNTDIIELTYVFSSNLPIYTLWVISIVLPIRYAKRQPVFAGFGYAILYFGMLLTSLAFLLFPENTYTAAIALVLVFAVAALVLIYNLYSAYDRKIYLAQISLIREQQSQLTQSRQGEEKSNGQNMDYASITSKLGLTPRESELFPFVISPLTADEIAKAENLSVATVKFHIGNILSKTSCKNRRELQMLVEGNQRHIKNDSTDI